MPPKAAAALAVVPKEIGPPVIVYNSKNLGYENCFGFAMDFEVNTWHEFHKQNVFLQIDQWPQIEREAIARSGGVESNAFQIVKTEMVAHIINMLTIHGLNKTKTKSIPIVFKSRAAGQKLYATHPALKRALGGNVAHFYQMAVFADVDFKNNGANSDFHFARRVSDGTWYHKPGQTAVTDKDAFGKKITDIASVKLRRGDSFYKFVCILYVLWPDTRRIIAKSVNIPNFDELGVIAIENAAYVDGDRILPISRVVNSLKSSKSGMRRLS